MAGDKKKRTNRIGRRAQSELTSRAVDKGARGM